MILRGFEWTREKAEWPSEALYGIVPETRFGKVASHALAMPASWRQEVPLRYGRMAFDAYFVVMDDVLNIASVTFVFGFGCVTGGPWVHRFFPVCGT